MHIGVAVGKIAVAGSEELACELIDFVGIFGGEVVFFPVVVQDVVELEAVGFVDVAQFPAFGCCERGTEARGKDDGCVGMLLIVQEGGQEGFAVFPVGCFLPCEIG